MRERSPLDRLGPALAGLAALLVLSTCEPPNPDYTQRHPLGAAPETVSVPAYYVGGQDPFAGSEGAARLSTLVSGYLTNGHGPLSIAAGAASPAASSEAAARIEALRRRLVAAGVPASDIHAALGSQGTPDTVTVSYERYVAVLPACGDWSTVLNFTPNNQIYPDYGCAQQHNLGAMVADPADLVGARPETPVRAIDIERAAAPPQPPQVTSYTGLSATTTSAGSSSSTTTSTR